MWGNTLTEIGTNELISATTRPNGSNWPTSSNSVWRKSNRNEWVTETVFNDVLYAGNCSGTFSPAPTDPNGNGNSEATSALSEQAHQDMFMGSLSNGYGAKVRAGSVSWYIDHGKAQ